LRETEGKKRLFGTLQEKQPTEKKTEKGLRDEWVAPLRPRWATPWGAISEGGRENLGIEFKIGKAKDPDGGRD